MPLQPLYKAAVILTLGSTSACGYWRGESSDRPTRQPPAEETGFALRGMNDTDWESTCIAGGETKDSARIAWNFADRTMSKLTSYYHGASCAESELYAQRGVAYEQVRISDHGARFADSFRIKSRLVAVTFAPMRPDFATSMNAETAYGSNDWSAGTFKPVTGLVWESGSAAEPKKGKAFSLIYKIEQDTMYFAYTKPDGTFYYELAEPFHRK